jgi:hypothetical protein
MHFLRRADDQGSKMREIDEVTYRPERGGSGSITLRGVKMHARPILKTFGW